MIKGQKSHRRNEAGQALFSEKQVTVRRPSRNYFYEYPENDDWMDQEF